MVVVVDMSYEKCSEMYLYLCNVFQVLQKGRQSHLFPLNMGCFVPVVPLNIIVKKQITQKCEWGLCKSHHLHDDKSIAMQFKRWTQWLLGGFQGVLGGCLLA